MKYLQNIDTGQVMASNPILERRKDMRPFEFENTQVQAEQNPKDGMDTDELYSYKKDELIDLAIVMGLELPEKINKADLIGMIVRAKNNKDR